MKHTRIYLTSFLLIGASVGLAACEGAKIEQKYPTGYNRKAGDGTNDIYKKPESVLGDGGLFGKSKKESTDTGGNIGVNTFLWRASLDTVSFMPIASADPFGGTIFTDWYEDPETPGTRFKLNVLILDRELKASGIRVRVFKQAKDGSGTWADAPAPEEMGSELEESILVRARQMRTKKISALN